MSKPTDNPATEPLTPERLAEIQARLGATSGLDWGYFDGGDYADVVQGYVPTGRGSYSCTHQVARLEADNYLTDDPDGDDFDPDDEERANQQLLADAEFIAHAPRDMSDLLAEVGWLAAELADRTAELTTSAGVAEQAWERNTALLAENARLRRQLAVEHEVIDHPRVLIGLAQHTTPRWHERYEDEHGRALLVFPGIEGDGIHLATDPKGCDVSLGTVEAVVSALREAARRTTLTGPSRAAMLCLPADTPDHEMGV